MAKDKKQKPGEEPINYKDIISVYDELGQLQEENPDAVAGVKPEYNKRNPFERFLAFYLRMYDRYHIETRVKRKPYLWLHLLGGFGVHHFYAHHWIKGLIYLAFCWCGISYGLTFIDWMEAFPKKPDADGMIVV